MTIGAFIPVKTRDLHYCDNLIRLKLLLKSLEVFAQPGTIGRIVLCVPDEEQSDVAAELAGMNVEIVPDSYMLKDLNSTSIHNWFKQQALKISAYKLFAGQFYITFDPDIFATKCFAKADLIPDGRSVMDLEMRRDHPEWWDASAQILQIDREDIPEIVMTVTPCIYHSSVLMATLFEIERLHGASWDECLFEKFNGILWVEHALYYLGALKLDMLSRFHDLSKSPYQWRSHSRQNIWKAEDLQTWSAERCFSDTETGVFAVIGSSTEIPGATVEALLRPWLGSD